MSEETTKPNGGRENYTIAKKVAADNDEVEKGIRRAGYEHRLNYMEAVFLPELIKYFHDKKSDEYFNSPEAKKEIEEAKRTSSSNNTSSNNEGGVTAGNYTIAGTSGTVSFINKVPDIAKGIAAPLRDVKDKEKTEKLKKSDKTREDE